MEDTVGLALPEDFSNEAIMKEVKEARKDTQAVLDACKELTKIVGDLAKHYEKWSKAGKF